MSREGVVLVRCDSCGAAADEHAPVQEAIPITFGKDAREIDLCGQCREQAEGVIGDWIDCARKVPKQAAAKKAAAKKATTPKPDALPKVKCPTCKKPFDPRGLPI